MISQLSELSPNQRYHLITQCLVPRPIAWVLTGNEDNSLNLAPFSYFGGVSSDPPLIMLSIGKKSDGSDKDTRKNIIRDGHFVIHIPDDSQVNDVSASAASFDYQTSEVDALQLATQPFADFSLPRLCDTRVAFACTRYRIEDITASQAMVLGEIQTIYVDDNIVQASDGRVSLDQKGLSPLSRLGGNEYGTLGEIASVTRPK